MKLHLIKISFLLLLLPMATLTQDDCRSVLIVNTDNYSWDVYIDSVYSGKTNEEFSIGIGKHMIVLTESKQKWGSSSLVDTIEINECNQTYEFSYNIKEKVLLTSEPPDAEVKSGSEIIGYTPLKIKPVESDFTLSKEGYSEENILLDPQKTKYQVDLEFTGIKESVPFTRTTTFKILIGSAIVLGGTAAYFKLEADKKFDKYLETRHSKYLDDTDQYDLYSGLAFGALQINFGALLYFFLTEN